MSDSPSAPLARTAWIVVAVLFPVALLNYLDRQMLAAMKESVMRSIPSIGSDENWGFLPAVFKWVYAALSPIGGYVADRFGHRRVITSSLLVWSAVTFGTGLCTTYHELLAARALMGISEAFYIPAALALIAGHHPGPTRSRAVGLHQMGIYCGVIAGSFSGYAAESSLGWRGTFDVCGLAGIFYALPLFFLLRPPPRLGRAPAVSEPAAPVGAMRELFGNGSFVLMVFHFTLPAVAAWIVRDWMPAILQSRFQLGQGKAGVSASLYWQLAAIASAWFGGWLADRWSRRTVRGRIYVSALGTACLVPAMFGIGNAASLEVAVAFLVLFGMGWGFFDANNMPILCQIVRPRLRATAYGFLNLVSISAGGFADWGFGIARDRHLPQNAIFGAFASAALLSVVIVLLIRPKANLETQ